MPQVLNIRAPRLEWASDFMTSEKLLVGSPEASSAEPKQKGAISTTFTMIIARVARAFFHQWRAASGFLPGSQVAGFGVRFRYGTVSPSILVYTRSRYVFVCWTSLFNGESLCFGIFLFLFVRDTALLNTKLSEPEGFCLLTMARGSLIQLRKAATRDEQWDYYSERGEAASSHRTLPETHHNIIRMILDCLSFFVNRAVLGHSA